MLNDESHPEIGVLYVDDEEKALKYFRMAFAPKFTVFTASSAAQGLEILRANAARISLVLSDQRMPETLGAVFLGRVRQEFPNHVRMLTTAYSDLDSAIQAVNQGHIYQYVTKPWKPEELAIVLRRAADYHHVLSERNQLLALKMTTLQRILCSDRLKWLLIHSRSLSERKQAAFRRALMAFLKALPPALNPVVSDGAGFSRRNFDIGGLIRDEYLNAAHCLDLMNSWATASAAQPLPQALEDRLESLDSAGHGEVWNLPDSLRNFLTVLIPFARLQPEAVTIEAGNSREYRIAITPGADSLSEQNLVRALFGLLIEREAPEVSVLFFETLLALSVADASLALNIGTILVTFSPAHEEDSVEAIIAELYEKFSAADIAQL